MDHLPKIYAALGYLTGLFLLLAAAIINGTHLGDAFIFLFVPGALFAALSPFIWMGRRWAMILGVVVAATLELMVLVDSAQHWWLLLILPVVFGALTIVYLAAVPAGVDEVRLTDQVYAGAVYVYGVLLVLMVPYNHSPRLGVAGMIAYVMVSGAMLGGLSVAVALGRRWAMLAVTGLAVCHWLLFYWLTTDVIRSLPYLAAAVASLILTAVCLATRARARRPVSRS